MPQPQTCDTCGSTRANGAWIQQGRGGGQRPITRCATCHGQAATEAAATWASYRSAPTGFAPSGTPAPRATASDDPHAWYGGRGSLLHPSQHHLLDQPTEENESPSVMASKMLTERASQNAEMDAWHGIFNDKRKR